MHLHEYQAKALFAEYGVPVLAGRDADSPAAAGEAARDLGGEAFVVKAQVHAGGRGKAGGVRRAADAAEVEAQAAALLGTRLVTPQTGSEGLPVERVLVEQAQAPERELYLGMLLDRARSRVTVMASAAGGVDIETLAAEQPERILSVAVHPTVGLQPFQCRRIAFGLGLAPEQMSPLVKLLMNAYRLYREHDISLLEINPLGITADNALVAFDAKLVVDDNALYRQKALADAYDTSQEDTREQRAREHGLNYIALDGDIACMVNGAGLAMATMDLIKREGGQPANFLDVGGTATAERVAEAFKLILADAKVQAILVNIFGGIVRCDLIAEGIIQALQDVEVSVPVVVRLAGTNAEEGRQLLASSALAVTAATDLTSAAREAIARAHGQPGAGP